MTDLQTTVNTLKTDVSTLQTEHSLITAFTGGADGLSQTILGLASLNIIDAVYLSSQFALGTNAISGYMGFIYDDTNKVLKFPPQQDYGDVRVALTIDGSYTEGGANADRQLNIILARAAYNEGLPSDNPANDGLFLRSAANIKLLDAGFELRVEILPTFVQGLSDPFITDGIKVVIENVNTQSFLITGIRLFVNIIYGQINQMNTDFNSITQP